MPEIKTVFAYLGRPATAQTERGNCPALQFILENGDDLTVVLSGEGMAQVATDIGLFLAGNPALAATKSVKPQ
jgi:hypothetical protein